MTAEPDAGRRAVGTDRPRRTARAAARSRNADRDRRSCTPASCWPIVPLVWILWTVISKGLRPGARRRTGGRTRSAASPPAGSAAAPTTRSSARCCRRWSTAIISVPIGVLTAIYLVEYGRGRLARLVSFMVDILTGIPSIVAALFIYALWVTTLGFDRVAVRRLARAGAADDAGRRALDRGDAQARAERAARGVVRARRARSGRRSPRSCCRRRSAASSPASCSAWPG